MSSMPAPASALHDPSAGGRLVATDGRTLPFVGADLSADAAAGLARVVLRQTFVNPYDVPLRVTYQVPLPADAAVSGYAFTFDGHRVVGEVDRKAAARERFEQALVEGRTAAILEQDRSSLFTQEVGNVPAGAEVVCELILDQPLKWLSEGRWEWRFPTTVAPRYQGAQGRVPDAERVSVEVSVTPMAPRVRMALAIRDALSEGGAVTSPSHALALQPGDGALQVGLSAEDGARLDRDVVVRWPVARPEVGLALDVARPGSDHPRGASAFGRLVLVPPQAERAALPRDLVVLLDTSGSMSGEPLDQAKAVVSALIGTLDERDTLDLFEFSVRPRRWRKAPVKATPEARAEALSWVRSLRAGGGTEMRSGILAALEPLRAEAQRQVLLVTDGLIGFEHEIVAAIRERLPSGCRVHTLGIGNAVNRSLTGPAARAGGGVEVIVAPGEDPTEAAQRLVARTDAPLVVDLALSGTALRSSAASGIPDLYGGAPAQVPVELSPEGGTLTVRGRMPAGSWEQRLVVPPVAPASGSSAVVKGFARERVEDLEIARASGEQSVDAHIEQLGLDFQIATRLTSWVAVSDAMTVDPGEPSRKERIPHELPHGMSVEGLGLRGVAMGMPAPGAPPMFAGGRARRVAAPKAKRSLVAGPVDAVMGIAGAIGDMFFGGGGADDEAEEREIAAEAPRVYEPEAAATRPALPVVVRGRIVLEKDGKVVVEITLDADGAWDPAEEATLQLEDGTIVTVRVDRAASTRKGPAPAGSVLRMVLLAEPAAPIRRVRLQSAGSEWVVRL